MARYIQSFQRSKSNSGPLRSLADPCLTSGYISEESDDSSFSFVSMDDGLFFNDDMESDGKISAMFGEIKPLGVKMRLRHPSQLSAQPVVYLISPTL